MGKSENWGSLNQTFHTVYRHILNIKDFTFPTNNSLSQVPPVEYRPEKSPWRFFSRRVLIGLIFLLIFIILGGSVTVLAIRKQIKTAFKSDQVQPSFFQSLPTKTPTTTPLPTQSPQLTGFKHLPNSCLSDPESKPCRDDLQKILDQECGGDPEAPACATYFQEAVALQTAHECQKDPNSIMCRCLKEKDPGECVGQKIRSETFGKMFCEIAKQPIIGQAFSEVCRNLTGSVPSQKPSGETPFNCQVNPYDAGCRSFFTSICGNDPFVAGCEETAQAICTIGPTAAGCEEYCLQNPQSPACLQRCQTDLTLPGCQELMVSYCQAYPYQSECVPYFEAFCSQQIYDLGCIQYCQQNPYSQGCVGFLLNYCRGNLTDSLCMSVLCDRAPQLCTLCQQFPDLCNQIWTRF